MVPDVRFLAVVLVFFVVEFAGVLALVFAELDLAVLAGALLVVRDDLLIEIARRNPTRDRDLQVVRGLSK